MTIEAFEAWSSLESRHRGRGRSQAAEESGIDEMKACLHGPREKDMLRILLCFLRWTGRTSFVPACMSPVQGVSGSARADRREEVGGKSWRIGVGAWLRCSGENSCEKGGGELRLRVDMAPSPSSRGLSLVDACSLEIILAFSIECSLHVVAACLPDIPLQN